VYWPYTTSKVLTLEYLEGVKITDFDEIDRRDIDRKEVARILAEAYAQMFFVDGFFHGDPHPGNIFVRRGPEVILVDFGMVDRITAPKKEGLRQAFIAIVERDSLGLVRAMVDMGFIPLTKDIQRWCSSWSGCSRSTATSLPASSSPWTSRRWAATSSRRFSSTLPSRSPTISFFLDALWHAERARLAAGPGNEHHRDIGALCEAVHPVEEMTPQERSGRRPWPPARSSSCQSS